mgnify:CR=1 FL=1
MNISSWISFEPGSGDEKSEEIDSLAKSRLAAQIQTRLRNQVDPGIDLQSARRAQSIQAREADGQIVISEDDQAKLFSGGQEQGEDDSEPPAGNLDDLFKPGSGVPESVSNPDGSTQLVFRSIKAADVFGEQTKLRRSEATEHAISDALRNGVVDAIENATDEVERMRGGGRGR